MKRKWKERSLPLCLSTVLSLGGAMPMAYATETELAETELAEAELIETELAESELVETELVKAELVEAELVEAELTEFEPTASELVEAEFAVLSLADQLLLSQATVISGDSATSQPVGTAERPFLISTVSQLQELAMYTNAGDDNFKSAHYLLLQDLDCAGADMQAIGHTNNSTAFSGTFDGNGFAVYNLTLTDTSASEVGLFGYTAGATIKNLGVVDCEISGKSNIGGLVGYAFTLLAESAIPEYITTPTVIDNCFVTGTVTGTNEYVGGLIGQTANYGTSVSNCYSTATVTAAYRVGGLIGAAGGTEVESCYATGDVTGNGRGSMSTHVGGLIGSSGNTQVTNCYATGDVTGIYSFVGGLSGSGVSEMTNCYATGTVVSTDEHWGLTGDSLSDRGKVGGITGDTYWNSTNVVALNFSVGAFEETNMNRLAGIAEENATISNSYAWGGMKQTIDGAVVTPPNWADADSKGTDLTYNSTNGLSTQFSVIFDNDSAWEFTEDGLPTLKNVGGEQSSELPWYIIHAESDPIYISTVEELQAIPTTGSSGKTYVLINDIDLSGVEWTAIGASNRLFQGTFDGNGFVIKNLGVGEFGPATQGLFGGVGVYDNNDSAVIKNVGIVDCNIIATSTTVGGLVGFVHTNTEIENCYVTGTVTAPSHVGGLIGTAKPDSGTVSVKNCYSTATVTATENGTTAGGLMGSAEYIEVENCYATGAVTNEVTTGDYPDVIAGLIGSGHNSTIKNSVALNPSIVGDSTNIKNRIIASGTSTSTLSDNYAWNGMTVNGNTVSGGLADNASGADLIYDENTGLSKQFSEIFGAENTAWAFTENGLPILAALDGEQSSELPKHITGEVEVEETFEISTVEQLLALADAVNGGDDKSGETYILMNDIDLSGVEWTSIGAEPMTNISDGIPFSGIFDGQGFVIKNITVALDKVNITPFGGLFGYVKDATIQNVGIENCNIENVLIAGGLVGVAEGTTLIENCYVTGTVLGLTFSGGIAAATSESTTIQNCYSTATVTGDTQFAGGIVGSSRATIENCYATGAVSGTSNIGGLVGDNSGDIRNSMAFNSMIIASTSSSGDGVGRIEGTMIKMLSDSTGETGTIENNYAWSRMSVNGESVTDGEANNKNGQDTYVIDGQFGIRNEDTWTFVPLFGNTTLDMFDTNVWEIPTVNGLTDAYMLLPRLKGVGNDFPTMSLEQMVVAESTVTFDADNETATTDVTTLDMKVVELPANPEKADHTFDGWFTDNVNYDREVTTETLFIDDMTVYAKWTEIPVGEFVISFDSNGGTVVDDMVTSNQKLEALPTAPTKIGFTFDGWYLEDTLTTTVTTATAFTATTTVYAKWTELPVGEFTISFDSNGGTVVDDMVTSSQKLEALPTAPTKIGFTFDGWYLEDTLTTAVTTATAFTATTTVYAKWTELPVGEFTISFDSNGGTVVDDMVTSSQKLEALPTAPTKIGFTFGGWYLEDTLTTAVTTATAFTATTTVYAKWTTTTTGSGGGGGGSSSSGSSSSTTTTDTDVDITETEDELTDFVPTVDVDDATPDDIPFGDVNPNDWFYESVQFAYENGLLYGTSDTKFTPYGLVTREMVAAILHRLSGEASSETATAYPDLSTGQWYTDAVLWCTAQEVMFGYTDGTFGIGKSITREELVTTVYRYADSPTVNGDLSHFNDNAAISTWATDAMTWAVAEGILVGNNGIVNPKGTATRAELSAIMMRFITNN